jgi:DNA-directed RNA polymerase subunit omega
MLLTSIVRILVEFYCKCETGLHFALFFPYQHYRRNTTLRDDYLRAAQKKITDPMILVNVVSRRAKQLKSGYKPLIESLERLSAEDMALREIMEGKITYQLNEPEED